MIKIGLKEKEKGKSQYHRIDYSCRFNVFYHELKNKTTEDTRDI